MYPNIKTATDKPITLFKSKENCVCSVTNYFFEIIEASYCRRNRNLYLKYKITSQTKDFETYTIENYATDGIEFYFLIQNLFKPYCGEMFPLYEKDFIGLSGMVHTYVVHSKLHLDTLTIRINN